MFDVGGGRGCLPSSRSFERPICAQTQDLQIKV